MHESFVKNGRIITPPDTSGRWFESSQQEENMSDEKQKNSGQQPQKKEENMSDSKEQKKDKDNETQDGSKNEGQKDRKQQERQHPDNDISSPQIDGSPSPSAPQSGQPENGGKGSSGDEVKKKKFRDKIKDKVKKAKEKLNLAKQKAKNATNELAYLTWKGMKKVFEYTLIIVVGVGLFEYHTDRTFGNFWGEVNSFFVSLRNRRKIAPRKRQARKHRPATPAQRRNSGPTTRPVKRAPSTRRTSTHPPRRPAPRRRVAPKKAKKNSRLKCMKFQQIKIKNTTISVSKSFYVILVKKSGSWNSKNYWTKKHIQIFFRNPRVISKLTKEKLYFHYIMKKVGRSQQWTLIYYFKKKTKRKIIWILDEMKITQNAKNVPMAYISYKQQKDCFTN